MNKLEPLKIYSQNNARSYKTQIVTPTGISASNFDEAHASTIHSFFQIPVNCEKVEDRGVEDIWFGSNVLKRFYETKMLIIDEISMVSAELLEMMPNRSAGKSNDLQRNL